MSSLIVDIDNITSADTSEADTYTDVLGLSQASVNVSSATNIILMMAVVPLKQDASDDSAQFRFTIDGTLVGPSVSAYKDDVNEGCGIAICWAQTVSAGNHTFALQWQTVGAGGLASTDESRPRSLQVIELTNSSFLFNLVPTSAHAATTSFADITGMTATATPTAGSVHLFLMTLDHDLNDVADEDDMELQMTIGGTREGPELAAFKDNADDGCGNSFMWIRSGLAASSTDFALQVRETQGSVDMDTGIIRSFQCIEITTDFTLHASLDIQTSHSLTGSFANIAGMTATFSALNTNSVLLFAAGVQPTPNGDNTGAYSFAVGGTIEGPQQYIFGDSTTEFCGHSIYYAKDAPDTDSHTYTLQGINVASSVTMDTTRDRSFCALELKVAGGVTRVATIPASAYSVVAPTRSMGTVSKVLASIAAAYSVVSGTRVMGGAATRAVNSLSAAYSTVAPSRVLTLSKVATVPVASFSAVASSRTMGTVVKTLSPITAVFSTIAITVSLVLTIILSAITAAYSVVAPTRIMGGVIVTLSAIAAAYSVVASTRIMGGATTRVANIISAAFTNLSVANIIFRIVTVVSAAFSIPTVVRSMGTVTKTLTVNTAVFSTVVVTRVMGVLVKVLSPIIAVFSTLAVNSAIIRVLNFVSAAFSTPTVVRSMGTLTKTLTVNTAVFATTTVTRVVTAVLNVVSAAFSIIPFNKIKAIRLPISAAFLTVAATPIIVSGVKFAYTILERIRRRL